MKTRMIIDFVQSGEGVNIKLKARSRAWFGWIPVIMDNISICKYLASAHQVFVPKETPKPEEVKKEVK